MTDTATTEHEATTAAPTARPRPALTVGQSVTLGVAHAAASVLLSVLRLRGLYWFACLFGVAEYVIDRRRRRRFARALAMILERKPTARERRKWTLAFFMQTRCDKLFYFIIDRLPRDKIDSLVRVSDEALLQESLGRGKGALFGLQHLGSHHIGGMLLALQGFKIAGVRDANESAIRRFMQDRWERRHPDLPRIRYAFSDTFPREIYRWYREGYLIGAAMDLLKVRDPKQKVTWLEVFGARRPFLTGPMRIALRSGAPVLHGWVEPLGGFRYELVVAGRLIDPNEVTDEEAAIDQAVRMYAATLENTLKRRPSLLSRL